jgi:3-methyladenine DNA glycosylase AlkD
MIRSMPASATATNTAKETRRALALLKRKSSRAYRSGMARYAIPTDRAFGVPVGSIRSVAKLLGRNHHLALALWKTGWFEARMLATMVDEPARLTPGQMDRWCRDFDNWAICDTACFGLFDRSPHAFRKVEEWAPRKEEFVRRAAFALMASVALHDKTSPDRPFVGWLSLIERGAKDDRNFVKKGVSWALRTIGARNLALHRQAISTAKRLGKSDVPSARWVGNDALRDLQRPLIAKRLAKREGKMKAKARAL